MESNEVFHKKKKTSEDRGSEKLIRWLYRQRKVDYVSGLEHSNEKWEVAVGDIVDVTVL